MRPSRRFRYERWVFRLLVVVFLRGRWRTEGAANIPRTGPCIVVGNHVGTVDPPLVGYRTGRLDAFTMTKAEAFRKRWGRFFITGWNGFPVVRHSADRQALNRALGILAAGQVVVLFPEGSRSVDGSLTRAYPGVGFLARHSGAPVVVAAVTGSEHVIPKGSLRPRGADVLLRFGEPFTVPKRHLDGRRLGSQEAADLIMVRLAGLLPPERRGAYADGVPVEAAPSGRAPARAAAAADSSAA